MMVMQPPPENYSWRNANMGRMMRATPAPRTWAGLKVGIHQLLRLARIFVRRVALARASRFRCFAFRPFLATTHWPPPCGKTKLAVILAPMPLGVACSANSVCNPAKTAAKGALSLMGGGHCNKCRHHTRTGHVAQPPTKGLPTRGRRGPSWITRRWRNPTRSLR